MAKRFSIASALLTLFAALLALVLVAATPALAHHKNDHEQGTASQQTEDDASDKGNKGDKDGDADSDANTAFTEDNDTNDGNTPNNVSDDGDNAHPSGKDRSVENGGSGNQGNSESDPDDDGRGPDRTNGGPDKPNGSGGVDLADQDGNNGCGNDDDFEDDNEGWCGKPPGQEDEVQGNVVTPPPPPTCPEIMGSAEKCQPVQPNIDEQPEKPETEVLGEIISRGRPDVLGTTTTAPATRAAGAILPFTGVSVTAFLIVALGLLGVGFALMRTRSSR